MGHRYQQMDIATATPESLVAKLLAAAIRHARIALETGGPDAAKRRVAAISRVVAIVGELRACLDHEPGGEIAANLESLYDFVLDRMVTANLEQTREPIEESIAVLGPIEEAWAEIAQQPRRAAG